MSDIRYIIFKGGLQPKNPMEATDDKLKELSSVGYRQGTDYDIVSLKVLEDMLGGKKFAHGGMMNMDEMTRPLGYKFGTKDGTLVGDREKDLKEWEEDAIDRLRKAMEREKYKKNILKNLPEIFDDPKKLEEFFKKIPGEEKKELPEKGPYKFKNIDPEKFIEKGPYIIPRDEEGNRIPFEQPAPKPFIITPEMREKFKEMNPIQLLGSGIFSKAAEASTRIDFLKSRRAQLMSDIQGEMLGNIFGTGVDEGKIKILQIEIDKLTKELNNLGEN